MVSMIMRSCIVVVLVAACGKVDHGQVQSVQDGSRVLGLVANDDGTYEFKLCDKLDAYPDEVLADTSKCINPLMNADGSAKVFNARPATPSTVGTWLFDGAIALTVATIAGVLSYGVARYLVKTKVIKRLAREKYVVGLEDSYNATIRQLPDGEAEKMATKWKEKRIMVESDGSWQLEQGLREHILGGNKLKKFNKKNDAVEQLLIDLDSELKSGERYTARIAKGLDDMVTEAKQKKPTQLQEPSAEKQTIDEISKENQDALPELQELLEKKMVFDDIRVYLEENERLAKVELSPTVKKYLKGMTLPEYVRKLDDDTSKFLARKIIKNTDDNLGDLGLLTSEELLMRKKNLDNALEVLKKIDTSTLDKDGAEKMGEAIKEVNELIGDYPVADNHARIVEILTDAKSVKGETSNHKTLNQELAKTINLMSSDLKRARKQLRERIKPTTEGSPEKIIAGHEKSVRNIVNNTPNAKKDGKRRLAENAGNNGEANSVDGHQKASFWDRVRGITNYRHDEIVIDKDEVVKDLVEGKDRIVDIKKGKDKLVSHLTGLLAFTGLIFTEDGSRKLPGNKRIAVAKRWHDLTTGDYSSSATRVDDLRRLIDGLAEVSGARVSPEVFYFLLRSGS